jgi:hypothetical protein
MSFPIYEPYFDEIYYRRKNPDVIGTSDDIRQHWITHGLTEFRPYHEPQNIMLTPTQWILPDNIYISNKTLNPTDHQQLQQVMFYAYQTYQVHAVLCVSNGMTTNCHIESIADFNLIHDNFDYLIDKLLIINLENPSPLRVLAHLKQSVPFGMLCVINYDPIGEIPKFKKIENKIINNKNENENKINKKTNFINLKLIRELETEYHIMWTQLCPQNIINFRVVDAVMHMKSSIPVIHGLQITWNRPKFASPLAGTRFHFIPRFSKYLNDETLEIDLLCVIFHPNQLNPWTGWDFNLEVNLTAPNGARSLYSIGPSKYGRLSKILTIQNFKSETSSESTNTSPSSHRVIVTNTKGEHDWAHLFAVDQNPEYSFEYHKKILPNETGTVWNPMFISLRGFANTPNCEWLYSNTKPILPTSLDDDRNVFFNGRMIGWLR